MEEYGTATMIRLETNRDRPDDAIAISRIQYQVPAVVVDKVTPDGMSTFVATVTEMGGDFPSPSYFPFVVQNVAFSAAGNWTGANGVPWPGTGKKPDGTSIIDPVDSKGLRHLDEFLSGSDRWVELWFDEDGREDRTLPVCGWGTPPC